MLRRLFLLIVTIFWLILMGQLIRREYFEIRRDQAVYEVFPITTTPIREDYRAVYLGTHGIGFDYHALEKVRDKPNYEYNHYDYELRHTSYMSFRLLGRRNEMFLKNTAWIDTQFNLKEFRVSIRTSDYQTKIEGKRIGDQLQILIQENDAAPSAKVIPVTGDLLYSESIENIWTENNLRVGKSGRFQIFNPLMLHIETLSFRVERKETLLHEGKETPVYLILLGEGLGQTRAWINETGKVLRKETPSGLVLVSKPGWEIFDAMREKIDSPPDLPHLYSIPSNLSLENTSQLRRLSVRIDTPKGSQEMHLVADLFEGLETIRLDALTKDQFPDDQQPSAQIQSDDPEIIKTAKSIVGDEPLALNAVLKIMRWVHENMTAQPTFTIPSATQVLKTRKGDCNEYTVLFTALTRALGIPTKMMAGLVYQQGRFFYHAWAAVYLGRWISMDPALNQAPADITHIPLVEGDLQQQIQLADQIGKIKITVLDPQAPEPAEEKQTEAV